VIRRERSHIVEREYLQRRLADAAIDLYAMSRRSRGVSSIRRAGRERPRAEIPHGEDLLRRRVAARAAQYPRRRSTRTPISTPSVAGLRENKGFRSDLH